MKVYWLEGIPGSGKSTLLESLKVLHPEDLIEFPKMDVSSIFLKGLSFDFRKYSVLGPESSIAIEMLKASVLNSFREGLEASVISERSYVSTWVYYSLLVQEKKMRREELMDIEKQLREIKRTYEERFIYVDCTSEESLNRDQWICTGFWKNSGRLEQARHLYIELLRNINNAECCVIPTGASKEKALTIAEAFINGK